MKELYRLLPDRFSDVVESRLSVDKMSEVRIRNGLPVTVCYDGVYFYLCKTGITRVKADAFTADGDEAERVVMRACERSLYTVTDTLRRGFISAEGGIRIGVCGSAVQSDGKITALKDISSVNIRIPHEVVGCAQAVYGKITSGEQLHNTLLISPPGAGKTTLLRDLCRIISDKGKNVLLCDERYEIASMRGGAPLLDVGASTDVISGADKAAVFEMGVASLRPDVMVTDELFPADIRALERALHFGVSIISTVHAKDLYDFMQKSEYKKIIDERVFSRHVVISAAPQRSVFVYDGENRI